MSHTGPTKERTRKSVIAWQVGRGRSTCTGSYWILASSASKCPREKSASICNAVQCWPHQRKRASSMHACSRKRKISENLLLLPRVQEDCQQRVHWILGHISQKSHSLKVSQESRGKLPATQISDSMNSLAHRIIGLTASTSALQVGPRSHTSHLRSASCSSCRP